MTAIIQIVAVALLFVALGIIGALMAYFVSWRVEMDRNAMPKDEHVLIAEMHLHRMEMERFYEH